MPLATLRGQGYAPLSVIVQGNEGTLRPVPGTPPISLSGTSVATR